ncbi:hypothetical protein [Legionella taurinensis]|uniref:Uncharacterized protein n=1 Tax=Legionella taurinensis TaxID=70611 RepID=A0A3A5L579_9GAMM|nr:hypothetical protein [Legionella taurinensis]RJT47975.1 hypothetical protein D6J04_05245 [Legionella taurinensis]RJT68189.1 hypothetical protein D6J03_05370 [Legionella taurinensis]STY25631.1 Uncharacterised protein [Legionella taurinensis]
MGKEFDKALNALDKIEKILSVVETITPFPPHSLDAYRLCAQSLRFQLSDPSESESISDVKNKLVKLKSLIKNIIVSHLDNITAPLHFTWNPSTANTTLSLGELKTRTENLAAQLREHNRASTKSLKLLRRKIADKAPQELLVEFDAIIKTLEQSPASPVLPETIHCLKNKAKMYKNKPKTLAVTIEEEKKPQSPLLKTIESLRLQLEEQLQIHTQLANQSFLPGFSEDFLLSDWVTRYQEKTSDADKARLFITGRIQHTLDYPDYHDILISELQRTVDLLKETNQQRNELGEKILARETLVYPTALDPAVLEKLMLAAKNTLKKQFETFLLTLCVIDVNNKDDKDTQFFVKNLLQFNTELKQKFQKYPSIVHSSARDALHDQLLMHLGEKKRFLFWGTALSKMEAKDIAALSNQLFDVDVPAKTDRQMYSKFIAAFYNLAAFIDAFPIQTIKNYHVLKEINEQEHLQILSKEKTILSDIAALTEELSEYFLLLPEVLGDNGPWKSARRLLGELETFRSEVENEAGPYGEEREKTLELVSPLDRVHRLASLQEKRLDQIANRSKILIDLQKQATPLIQLLKQQFEEKKKGLSQRLSDELANAEAALLFIKSTPELTFSEQEKSEFESAVDLAKKQVGTVAESKEHLFKLRRETDVAINHLKGQTKRVKEKLTAHVTPYFINANKLYEGHPYPLLDEDNPVKFTLKSAHEHLKKTLATLDKTFAGLETLQGREFTEWVNRWGAGERRFVSAFEHYQQKTQDAMEIERRLKTQTYKTSCEILTKLETEFERLTEKYIDQAIHKTSDENELAQLQQLKCLPKLPLVECKKPLMDRVDPRLHTLASMHAEFRGINQDYIHENVHLSRDETYFAQLKASADKHFRNNNMEKLSDGIRHKWVQFLRINVFKPLQALSFNLGNYLKSQSQELFFVTFGACRTERELAEFGHDLSSRLVAPAA